MKYERGDLVMYDDGFRKEFGVVTSDKEGTVYVRYIRTLANSEGTKCSDIKCFASMAEWLNALENT